MLATYQRNGGHTNTNSQSVFVLVIALLIVVESVNATRGYTQQDESRPESQLQPQQVKQQHDDDDDAISYDEDGSKKKDSKDEFDDALLVCVSLHQFNHIIIITCPCPCAAALSSGGVSITAKREGWSISNNICSSKRC
jgi:hypothetical protein